MTLNLTIQPHQTTDFSPRITVVGVGGGGTNAVDNMIALDLKGVEFVVANTDAQQLMASKAQRRIQLGPHLTQGLGAGAKPEIGRAAAEEAADELMRHLEGVHMVFITAGMGGGTGTGAAPVIARMARERGILTVGVVTKPFNFEGVRRTRAADAGIADLQQIVDTLIVIPNQNLFRLANERTGWKEAFKMADHVLYMGVRGVTDLMMSPGLVNLDFADIRTVMAEMGKAMMGTGEAEGEGRAIRAAEAAINNPLLEDTNMSGARGLLINITGGEDMTLFEVDEAANRIREEVAEDANIIFGSAIDEQLSGRVRVSVVATGIDSQMPARMEPPVPGNAERPRLVAVGNGAPVSAVAGPQQGGMGFTPGMAPSVAPVSVEPVYSPSVVAPLPGRPALVEAPAEVMPAMFQHGMPQAMAPGMAQPERVSAPALAPVARPAEQRSHFGARSLFGVVTGALRRQPPAPLVAEPPRSEPQFEAEPVATQRPADEMGLDIPAFLRRQQ